MTIEQLRIQQALGQFRKALQEKKLPEWKVYRLEAVCYREGGSKEDIDSVIIEELGSNRLKDYLPGKDADDEPEPEPDNHPELF